MKRVANAVWNGNLKSGSGSFSTPTSNVFKNVPYTFKTRFESEKGTNPEELIAAGHASCFSMALSAKLEANKFIAEHINTNATLTMENKVPEGWTIKKIHLDVTGKVPGVDQNTFQLIATSAKESCIISRALKAEITMDAKLIK